MYGLIQLHGKLWRYPITKGKLRNMCIENDFPFGVVRKPCSIPEHKKGTILMIHGWAQNASVMQFKTKNLTKKFNKAGYDCLFLEAPHLLPARSTVETDGESIQVVRGERKNAKAWFVYSEKDPTDTSLSQSRDPVRFIGLNDSLEYIKRVLNMIETHQPNERIVVFGFSQGGSFVHILSALASLSDDTLDNHRQTLSAFKRINCAILVGAFGAHYAKDADLQYPRVNLQKINIPALHVIGKQDTRVDPEKSLDLAKAFAAGEIFWHDKGHTIPQKSADSAVMVTFLNKYTNEKLK